MPMFHVQENSLKSKEMQQKNDSKKCGRKRKETEETEVDMETGMEMLDEILDMELLDETDEGREEKEND